MSSNGQLSNLPSVVVSQILCYLSWEDKMVVADIIQPWKICLRSAVAWETVIYGSEMEENIYFLHEKRKKFCDCIHHFGKYMKAIHLCFGYPLSVSPETEKTILDAIHDSCNLKYLKIEQEAPEEPYCSSSGQYQWLSNTNSLIASILSKSDLQNGVSICQPIIDWNEAERDNILMSAKEFNVTDQITELELTCWSFLNHEGKITMLKSFKSLRKLMIRREKVDNEIILHLVDRNLQELVLIQEEELPYEDQQDFREDFWSVVKQKCPSFKVDIILRCIVVLKILFPANMPLRHLILDFLVNVVTKGILDHISTSYKDSLQRFTYTNSLLENFETGDKRLPSALLCLVRNCKQLKTLEYGFPLSSTSILLIARTRKLKSFVVPKVEVSFENDWSLKNISSEDSKFFTVAGSSEENLEKAVSQILGFPWKLHDGQLKLNDRIKL